MSNDHPSALTRRQFLTRSAMAAAALPSLVPASALGRNGAVAPSERIVMGGIGLGGRGSYDLGAMLNERDVQWVAVCDVREEPSDRPPRTRWTASRATRIAQCIATCANSWPSGPILMPC